MARIARTKVSFQPLRLIGGANLAATGRKGGRGAMPAQSDGFAATNPFVGTKSVPSSASKILYGSSMGGLTVAQAVNQTVTDLQTAGHPTYGPLNADHMRVSQGSEPANWAGSGFANTLESSFPTVAYTHTFKVNDYSLASAAAVESATFGSGNAFFDKWLVIYRDQVPDVQKSDKRGNPTEVYVGAQHEPFGDTITGIVATGANWSQLQKNLCHIVRVANASRTHKLRVAGIFNGHDAAMAQFDTWYPSSLLTTYKVEFVIGVDCYDYMNTNGTIDGIYQYVRAHDTAVAKGYQGQWCVPELGVIIGSSAGRPTDAVALQMVKDIEAQNLAWPVAEHPTNIDWFNNGGQPFNGNDVEANNPATVYLPQAFKEWNGLSHLTQSTGLVPSNTLVPSATLVPDG